MREQQRLIHSIILETALVLCASAISIWFCDFIGIGLHFMPFVLMAVYALLKLLYHAVTSGKRISQKQNTEANHLVNSVHEEQKQCDVLKKRMELFHHEFQLEQQSYLLQKEKENALKMATILKYTRNTFKRLEFDESEIFQICECVQYFVTNRQVLNQTGIHIKRRVNVTQTSLKNFAWNIAYQYNISGYLTAKFAMTTFSEWFCNTSFETVRKNLRTTIGRHSIEIDEHIT